MGEERAKAQQEEEQMKQREAMRQKYFQEQKQQIEEYRLKREATENLLMIAASHGHVPSFGQVMS